MAKKSSNRLKNLFSKLWRFLVQIFVIGFQFTFLFIIFYRVIPVPLTPLHIERLIEQSFSERPLKLSKSWKSIDYVSDKFCMAVMTSEDIKFIHHYGFDFEQIQNSIEHAFKKGKKLSPLLLIRSNGKLVIADGYHRICASYYLSEDLEVPCRLV